MHKGLAIGLLTQAAAALAVASPGPVVGPSSGESPTVVPEFAAGSAVEYWSDPSRYKASLPKESARSGAFQVRLTPEGSQWLWNYAGALGRGKGGPTLKTRPSSVEVGVWDAWIREKIAYDRWIAAKDAAAKNGSGSPLKTTTDPGPAPDSLRGIFGPPPPFASAVQPMEHTVTFHDGTQIVFRDNPVMREDYAYYRSPQGVMSGGTPVKDIDEEELNSLFEEAKIPSQTRGVMKAVSLLEGGFDAVNTYDTGFVSIGFIQFACLKEGGGSLGAVLRNYKQSSPKGFNEDFVRFGLDVSDDGKLVATDLSNGEQKTGPEAAQLIIADKRLAAVFQRAGRLSRGFRVAQLRVAKELYYPGDDQIVVSAGKSVLSGKVSDVVKSEAGLATLMDRKVHTGRLDPLKQVLESIASTNSVTSFADLAKWEQEVVEKLKNRKSYLGDESLTQPAAAPATRSAPLTARKSTRKGRSGG